MSEDDPFAPPAAGQPPQPAPPPAWGQQPGWGQQPAWGQSQWVQPQWGYPPTPQGTNGLAIASLVTGILPLPPVAIGTGIGALVQIKHRQQSGRGMAISGIVLGGLWLLLLGALIVAGISGAFDADTLGRVSQAGSTSVGSCLVDPGSDGGTWEVTDCSQAHDAEVYVAAELPYPSWPGASDLNNGADDLCMGAFKGYVGEGYYSSDYDYGFFAPDEDEWNAGEHRIVCVVLAYDEPLRGSVRA